MRSRHPSRQRLERWLKKGETRAVQSHIDSCERCQTILESLSALEEDVVADLQTAIAPPNDLGERTNEGVDERLRNEAAAGAFLDLFAIGWDVMRAVVEPATKTETPHDDGASADEPTGGS